MALRQTASATTFQKSARCRSLRPARSVCGATGPEDDRLVAGVGRSPAPGFFGGVRCRLGHARHEAQFISIRQLFFT